MKISISYPPLLSTKGVPLLSQNRQFQWFNSPTYIYPVVPAYAATLLKEKGYKVLWDDGIAEGLTYAEWEKRIVHERPDLIAIETKTPVVKKHWKIIDALKKKAKKVKGWSPVVVLMGDHATAMPGESFEHSSVDYVLASGDYDFLLAELAEHLDKKVPLKPGFWYRDAKGVVQCTGPANVLDHNLDDLPMIDRGLTKWKLYAYKNGNFKYTPGTYMMSGRDCWWGKCTFCSWTTFFPGERYRARSAKKALDEVGHLIDLGVKEIMEDSGSLPIGPWLKEFCEGMIERGYNKKVVMSCNMRITGIKDLETWKLMKRAGFRFILFGLESGNQETLDRIQKGLKVEEIEPGLKLCKQGGLEPHITVMIGYPWETKEMAEKTICLAKDLFKKGYVDTLQATVLIPYPGTPLFKECQAGGCLATEDWDEFDQRKAIMRSPLTEEDVKGFTQSLYTSFLSPQFIFRKIIGIRSMNDVRFLVRAGFKVLGHLKDFSRDVAK